MQLNIPVASLTSRCPLLSVLGNLEFSTRVPMPEVSRPSDTFYVTQYGDSLPKLSFRFYNDVRLWWILYDANAQGLMSHPLDLAPQTTLRIPSQQTVNAELLNASTI